MTSPNPLGFNNPPPGWVGNTSWTPVPGLVVPAGPGLADEPTGTLFRTVPGGVLTSVTLGALNITGLVAVRSILLTPGQVISNISILFGTTGATGPTQLWAALTDANLNVLAVTGDQGAAAQVASTFTTIPLAAKYATTFNGLAYVLVSSSASTTAPTLAGAPVVGAGRVAGPPVFCGTAGSLATPPALGAQVNSGTITAAGGSNFGAWLS